MKKIKFTKMVASGNDFIVTENNELSAKSVCDRKFGIGADGLLVLKKSRIADTKMCIFNADGSEAEMCGNGARCAAFFVARQPAARLKKISIETKAGIIKAEVNKDTVKIRLTEPKGLNLDIPIKVNGRVLRVNFINTGVPHTVIFVSGIERIDVDNIGREVRYHKRFAPAGTNVNFVEVLDKGAIRIRSYERGVEGETLACGTGSTAAALVFALRNSVANLIKVTTESKEVLKVYFNKEKNKFKDVWLEGKAKIVYKGEYNV
jgi:diaminopimelate epimerase